MDTTIKLANGP